MRPRQNQEGKTKKVVWLVATLLCAFLLADVIIQEINLIMEAKPTATTTWTHPATQTATAIMLYMLNITNTVIFGVMLLFSTGNQQGAQNNKRQKLVTITYLACILTVWLITISGGHNLAKGQSADIQLCTLLALAFLPATIWLAPKKKTKRLDAHKT